MPELSHTEREILSQPQVWQETIDAFDAKGIRAGWGSAPSDVIVTGCGSTHYLALTAAELLRNVSGLRARATPASELMAQASPRLVDPGNTVLLAFSRSGTTSETLAAVDEFKRLGGGRVIAVTTVAGSPLATAADMVLVADSATEQSVAQTRSFTSMLVLAEAIAAVLGGHDLSPLSQLANHASDILNRTRESMSALARQQSLDSFYFLASGPVFGVASEGMLKLKEMSLTTSEAYHSLEFRHGPMSMCDQRVAVLALVTPERLRIERAVVQDVAKLGAHTTTVGPGEDVALPDGLPAWTRPVLYLLPLQLLALERALAKGLNPDQPRHLTAVIHLDPLPETA